MHDSEEIAELLCWLRTKEWHDSWIRMGRLAAVIANSSGVKIGGKPCKPIDFIPHEVLPQTEEEIERNLLAAFGVQR